MRELRPVFLGQHGERRCRVLREMAFVEALLVRLREVQDAERLAEAPGRVGALRLRVEPAKELVALHAVRVLPEHLRLRAHGLVEVVLDVARVEIGQDLVERLVVGIEGLRRLVGVDGHLRLAQRRPVELTELLQDDDELRAVVGLLRALELPVQEALDAGVIALLAAQIGRLLDRLPEARVELERPLVECERVVELADSGAMRRWRPCGGTSRAGAGPRRTRRA